MRLPLIKNLLQFIHENDEDYLQESIETLEHLSLEETLKDEEMDSIGEILSNLYGAMEVYEDIKKGNSERDALNGFMQRVMGSIDR